MVSFNHNRSKVTTWMGYSFKTKRTKSKAKQHSKIRTTFLNLKLEIIRLAQGNWSCTPAH